MSSLSHHGIKGQKWGVRRYQNKDGTRTALGKHRDFERTASKVVEDLSNSPQPFIKRPLNKDKIRQRGLITQAEADQCASLATGVFKQASQAEPQITGDVIDVVSSTSAKMYGLNNRLKQPTSIAAKIGADAKSDGVTFEQAANGLKDVIRYTAVSDSRDYVDTYNAIKQRLEKKGYTETKCKNYFQKYQNGEVMHKAVQSTFRSPDGVEFEFQFQTPESQAAKELKVPIYNERRKAGNTPERNAELEQEMRNLAEQVPDPEGVFGIKSHSGVTNSNKLKHTSIGGTMYIEGNALILGDSSYLEHHGIKGQRWGIRRFQNADGTRTAAGKKRYSVEAVDVNSSRKEIKKLVKGFSRKDKEFFFGRRYWDDDYDKGTSEEETYFGVKKRFVIKEGKDIVAFIDAQQTSEWNSELNMVIGTKASARGKGYASALAEKMVDWYDSEGYKSHEGLRWQAANENTGSRKIAEKTGFKQIDDDGLFDDEAVYAYSKNGKQELNKLAKEYANKKSVGKEVKDKINSDFKTTRISKLNPTTEIEPYGWVRSNKGESDWSRMKANLVDSYAERWVKKKHADDLSRYDEAASSYGKARSDYYKKRKAKHTSIGGTMHIEGNALILGDSSYLEHHGILGQKWGVRRFQNKDGTRTAAGKAREDRRVLKKGTTVKRTSYGMYDETYDNKKYVSTNDDDAGKWSRYIGEAKARQGAVVFENEYQLTRDVAVATGKDICKIIDSEFKNADVTKLKEDTDYAARALRQDLNNMSREERVSLNFAMQTQSGKKIVKLLKKHGYDALEDDHGKNVSKDPVIILDPKKNMKRTRVTANANYYFDYINHTSIDDSPYLSHHGIKGQRWGVRRFQNKDGTRTSAGKKREAENLKSSQEAKNVNSKIHSYINKQLSSEDLDTGKSNYDFASNLIKDPDFEKVIMPVVQDIRQTKAKYGNKEPYESTGDEHQAYMNDIDRLDKKTGELAIAIGLAEKGEPHKKSTPPEGEYERVDMFRYALARYLDEHSPDGYSDEGDWIYHSSMEGTFFIEDGTLYLSHHGIRGQRWGVRRFQNRDGSLTNAGRKRLGYATKGAVQTVSKAFKAGVKAGGNAVKAAKAHHEAAEAKKKEKKKEKASKTRIGVMANKDLFTNEEMRKLNERFKLEDEMKMATLQKGVEIAKAVGTIAQNVGTMAKAYEDVTGQSLSPIKRKAAEEKAKQDAEDRKRKLAKEDAETKRAEDKEKRDIEDRERRIKLEDEDRVRKQAKEDADAQRAENAEKRAQAKEQRDSSMAVELQRKAKAAADEQEHKAVKAKAESRSAILDVLEKIDKIQDHDDDDHNNPPGGGIDTWDDDDYLNFFKKTGIIHSGIIDSGSIQNGVLFVDSSDGLAHHGVSGTRMRSKKIAKYESMLKQSDKEEGMYHVENGTLFINAGEPYLEHHGVRGMKWGKHLMAGKGVDAQGGGGGGFAEDDEKLKEMAKKAGMSVAEYKQKFASKIGGAASKVGSAVYDAAGGSHKKNAEGWRKMAQEESNAARASERSSHENSARAASQDRKYGSGGDVYRRAADSDKENAKTHHSNAKARSERAASEQAAYEKSLAGKYDKMKAGGAKKAKKAVNELSTKVTAAKKRLKDVPGELYGSKHRKDFERNTRLLEGSTRSAVEIGRDTYKRHGPTSGFGDPTYKATDDAYKRANKQWNKARVSGQKYDRSIAKRVDSAKRKARLTKDGLKSALGKSKQRKQLSTEGPKAKKQISNARDDVEKAARANENAYKHAKAVYRQTGSDSDAYKQAIKRSGTTLQRYIDSKKLLEKKKRAKHSDDTNAVYTEGTRLVVNSKWG